MLKLSKMADYAVIIGAYIATRNTASHSAASIATATNLGEATVRKVLKKLSKENILSSTRGANGGYTLSLPPEQINMAHIVEAIDGPINITECVGEENNCPASSLCSTKASWNTINTSVRNALAGVSLLEISP